MKLFDSELKVMEVLWEEGPVPARRVVEVLSQRVGWNKNTTYTVIKKCMEKGAGRSRISSATPWWSGQPPSGTRPTP